MMVLDSDEQSKEQGRQPPSGEQSLAHSAELVAIDRRVQVIDDEAAELTLQLESGDASAQQSEDDAAKWRHMKPILDAQFVALQDERAALLQEKQEQEQRVAVPSAVNAPQPETQQSNGRQEQEQQKLLVGTQQRPPSPRRMADALDEAGLLRTRGHKYAASARRTLSVSIAEQTKALAEELALAASLRTAEQAAAAAAAADPRWRRWWVGQRCRRRRRWRRRRQQ